MSVRIIVSPELKDEIAQNFLNEAWLVLIENQMELQIDYMNRNRLFLD